MADFEHRSPMRGNKVAMSFAFLPRINSKADLLKPSTSTTSQSEKSVFAPKIVLPKYPGVINRTRTAPGVTTLQQLYKLGDHYWREQIEEHIEDHGVGWNGVKERLWSQYEKSIDEQLFSRFIARCKRTYDEVVDQQRVIDINDRESTKIISIRSKIAPLTQRILSINEEEEDEMKTDSIFDQTSSYNTSDIDRETDGENNLNRSHIDCIPENKNFEEEPMASIKTAYAPINSSCWRRVWI